MTPHCVDVETPSAPPLELQSERCLYQVETQVNVLTTRINQSAATAITNNKNNNSDTGGDVRGCDR